MKVPEREIKPSHHGVLVLVLLRQNPAQLGDLGPDLLLGQEDALDIVMHS